MKETKYYCDKCESEIVPVGGSEFNDTKAASVSVDIKVSGFVF